MILIPKEYKCAVVPAMSFCDNNGFQCLTIVIKQLHGDFMLSVAYRTPNYIVNESMFDFLTNFADYSIKNNNKVLMGDFNMPDINWETLIAETVPSRRLLIETSTLGLSQLVTFPTHNCAILDLVFVMNKYFVFECESDEPFGFPENGSDHMSISVKLNQPTTKEYQKRYIPDYANCNWRNIMVFLSNINWEEFYVECLNADDMWIKFKELCNFINTDMIPVKEITDNRCKNSVQYTKLLRFKSIEQRLRQIYKRKPCLTLLNKRKDVSRKVRLLKKEIDMLDEEYILANPNSRKFYSFIKSKLKANTSLPVLKSPSGTDLVSDKEKAEGINKYFNSVYQNSKGTTLMDIPADKSKDLPLTIFDNFKIHKYIKQLPNKTSVGHDNISYMFLKKLSIFLSDPISKIFKASFSNSCCPTDWRYSIIVPVAKKPNQPVVSNCRPISLTCTCSRLMEKIIRDELEMYCVKNNTFSNAQFGFVPKRCAEIQLLTCLNDYTNYIDKKSSVHIFYADINKAFDSVNHTILINKLIEQKIPRNIILWIKSFLTDRKHSVKIGKYISKTLTAASGVPQGAVLSPTLFALFVNNVSDTIKNSTIKMYADDVKLYKQICDRNDVKNLQNDITNFNGWLTENDMSLSANKCGIQKLGKKYSNTQYWLSDIEIPILQTYKDLGVLIDDKLSLNQQTIKIAKSAAMKIGCIRSCFKNKSKDFYKRMLMSYIRPTLEYNSSVWGINNIGHIICVERPHRRFTKLSQNQWANSYKCRLALFEQKSLLFRRITHDLVIAFKVIKGYYSNIEPNQFFAFNTSKTRRKNRFKLIVPYSRTSLRQNFWSVRIINLWNKIPDCVFDATTVPAFKSLLMREFTDEIEKYMQSEFSGIDFV